MTKVSVIIPYYQRESGLLRRALESVFAQELDRPAQVRVIVVDDQSPSPPELDVAGIAREDFAIEIVRRENGGPAKARNTGLKVVGDPDYIAFLDSDDWWEPRHLARGLAALMSGCQFYFANVGDGELAWFDTLACEDALIDTAEMQGESLRIPRAALMTLMIEEYISHTSTVIYSARDIGELLFDESQAIAGEDYLFWLTATDRSEWIGFTPELMARRGRGLDLYRSSFGWDSAEGIRRLYYNLILHKKILRTLL